jgi:hypothetical protein
VSAAKPPLAADLDGWNFFTFSPKTYCSRSDAQLFRHGYQDAISLPGPRTGGRSGIAAKVLTLFPRLAWVAVIVGLNENDTVWRVTR